MLRQLNCLLIGKLPKSLLRNGARNLSNNLAILSNKSHKNVLITENTLSCVNKLYYNTDASSASSATSTTTTTATDSKIQTAELIIHHHHEGILEVQLNKVDTKNALSKKLIFELGILIDSIKTDSRVRCILIRSMIPNVFCAGANLKERMKMSEKEVGPFVTKLRETFHELSKLPVPIIAAIDGAALGGGLELALSCDIRVASSNAKMGLVETKLAIIPGAGGTQRLPRIIGVSKAKELIFTSKILDGTEAEKIGLVNVCVQQNEQNDAAYKKALEMAQQIITNGPVAIQMAKLAIDSGIQLDIDSALKVEELCYSRVIPTKDRLEGLNSFNEKRPPKYIGE